MVGTRRLGRWLRSLSVAAAALGAAGRANAHGGLLRAFEILQNPAKPEQYIVRSDQWGFLHSSDGGRSWQWSCTNVYGSSVSAANHVGMALTKSGRLMIANAFQGVRFTDDFCTWSTSAGFFIDPVTDNPELANDVKVLDDGTVVTLVTFNTGSGMRNRLYESKDDGATFVVAAELGEPELAVQSFTQSPSNPQRMYVTGAVIGETRGAILRSDDGGATFQRLDAPFANAFNVSLRIHAVHPRDPDLVFLWVDLFEEIGEDAPDEIWVSDDAGRSWKLLLGSKGDLPGFAFSPDGETVAMAGPREGIILGAVARVVAEGNAALTAVSTLPTWGLHWTEAGMVAGKDNFSARGAAETFTMGVSRNGGQSFEQSFSVCDVQFTQCAAGTAGHDLCVGDWEDPVKGGFKKHHWEISGRCEAAPDGGAPPVTTPDAGGGDPILSPVAEDRGCACSAPGATGSRGAALALVLFAVGAGVARRRRP